jgi:hypothetical protein
MWLVSNTLAPTLLEKHRSFELGFIYKSRLAVNVEGGNWAEYSWLCGAGLAQSV